MLHRVFASVFRKSIKSRKEEIWRKCDLINEGNKTGGAKRYFFQMQIKFINYVLFCPVRMERDSQGHPSDSARKVDWQQQTSFFELPVKFNYPEMRMNIISSINLFLYRNETINKSYFSDISTNYFIWVYYGNNTMNRRLLILSFPGIGVLLDSSRPTV